MLANTRPILFATTVAILLAGATLALALLPASPPTSAAQDATPSPTATPHDPDLPQNQLVDEAGVEMVLVPAGCFLMGTAEDDELGWVDEQPAHEICFDAPFWMDKTEVTNAQYGDAPREFATDECAAWSTEPEQPANCVGLFEAIAHCASRDARLPTEAEWEYAARGPESSVYPWGDEWAAELVAGDEPERDTLYPVGSFPEGASWAGLLDMSGNAWESTTTFYRDYPYDPADGREELGQPPLDEPVVLRGGMVNDAPEDLRAAARAVFSPSRGVSLAQGGFRCVRALTEEEAAARDIELPPAE